MKKLIALLAVATMLFGLVGTASAYDVAMEVFVNPKLVQNGPDDYGWDGDLSVSYAPSNIWQFTNTINISLSGAYSDVTKWYNYSNSTEQAAWVRVPIIFDSVDGDNFPSINTKSTQWYSGAGKLIQAGTSVTINGVMYPVGVIQGRGDNYPFWADATTTGTVDADDKYIATSTGTNIETGGLADVTTNNALGIMYPIKLIASGMTETLNISYTPNGVEVYKATINVTYYDTASGTNNATIARETGDNAPYFNAKYTGGDTMAFDTVLKSGSMISTNEKYYFRSNAAVGTHAVAFELMDDDNDWPVYQAYNGADPLYAKDKGYVSFPTIIMTAKVKLLDKNGNALPVRTQIRGNVDANDDEANIITQKHYVDMSDTIVNTNLETAIVNAFLFRAEDVYNSTFSAATKTDDGYYHELDANGEFTVTLRVIDNSTALYKGMLNDVIIDAQTNKYTIKPYAVPLENVELAGHNISTYYTTIEGVKNRVNYTYLGDITQDVFTYSMYDRQFLSYDIKLNSMDRIEAVSFGIAGNTSENLPVGSTRQLQAITGTSTVVTDANVIWKSSNTAVATVNSAGLVTAVTSGTTYITATYAVGTGYDTVAVTVGEIPVATVAPVTPTTTQYFVAVGSSSSLNVRSGANTKSARVGRLKRGDTVNVYEIVDGWAKIDYNGSIAYVSSRYISQ